MGEPVARSTLPSFNPMGFHGLAISVLPARNYFRAPAESQPNKNAPDSNESWDVSVEQPSPENCSITLYWGERML